MAYRKTYELCPHCGREVELKAVMKLQKCPNCHKQIIPCSLCDMDKVDCSKCKLSKRQKIRNKF